MPTSSLCLSRLLILISLLLSFAAPAVATPEQAEIVLSRFYTRLQEHEDANGEDETTRAAVVQMFDDINDQFASARRFKALAAYMKKAVAKQISDSNKILALEYKALVNDLKAVGANKAQLKEASRRYSLSLSRVKSQQQAFNKNVDRVTREYIKRL